MFLAKTWLDKARLSVICDSIKLDDFFGVSRIGRGGGLAIFWRQVTDLHEETSSPNYINMIINKGREDS